MTSQAGKTPHIGHNIRKLRELQGMKQETLAQEIGVTQQMISHIEQSELVEEERLQQIALALSVTVEEIKNFNPELIFHNTVNDNGTVFNYIETYQNDSLQKVIDLYERIIKEKDAEIARLQKQ